MTGGAKGVGLAISKRLASEGARVIAVGRDARALAAAKQAFGVTPVVADLTDDAALDRALEQVFELAGHVDILVQNAGIAESAKLAATTDEVFDRIMRVNVRAPFRIARTIAPKMAARGRGRIVFIASNAGLTGYALTSAYVTSKHAVVGLMRALAAELAKKGVTVNAICPGFIDTEMTERSIDGICKATGRSRADARRALEALSPQNRLISPDEVAFLTLALCADAASGVNGQALALDGGQVM